MYGVEFYRRKNGLLLKELAAAVGTTVDVIRKIESQGVSTTSTLTYQRVSDVLGVPIDELISIFPDDAFEGCTRYKGKSRVSNPSNPIEVYRSVHRLSFKGISNRLGHNSSQYGQYVCKRPWPIDSNIKTLADYEGVSVQAFLKKYSRGIVGDT